MSQPYGPTSPEPASGPPQQPSGMPPSAPRPVPPAPGQPQAPFGYPGQPPYGAPQPPQVQPPGYPPYQQQPPQAWGQAPQRYPAYGTNPQYSTASTAKKSPVLGIVALAVVALSMIVGIALAISSSAAFESLLPYVQSGATQAEIQQAINQLPQAEQERIGMQLMGPILGIGAASLVGFIGWILAIVATATKRGRVPGIVGIILGVIAPVVIVIALGAAIAAVVPS